MLMMIILMRLVALIRSMMMTDDAVINNGI